MIASMFLGYKLKRRGQADSQWGNKMVQQAIINVKTCITTAQIRHFHRNQQFSGISVLIRHRVGLSTMCCHGTLMEDLFFFFFLMLSL